MPEYNLVEVFEAVAEAVPDRDCIVWRDRRFSYADTRDRARRLANYLTDRGLGLHTDRSELAGHESGQDHLGLYLYNGNEYLEGMLGGYKARVAPFNVNYRYVEEELAYLLKDAKAKAVIYSGAFAKTLQAVRHELPDLTTADGLAAAIRQVALAAAAGALAPEETQSILAALRTAAEVDLAKKLEERLRAVEQAPAGAVEPDVDTPAAEATP